MGSVDRVDDLTFRVNFSGDGAAKLRERVRDKLKEFMGDYTDDTLVEYVIVLLRNGRRKEEARSELNVFLGDDSNPFVSWLWDHLASNLDLYVPPLESQVEESAKTNSMLREQGGISDSFKVDSESERAKSIKLHRSRHKREWKGLVRDAADPPPLRSSEVNNIQFEERTPHKVSYGKSSSPHLNQKKRGRTEERQQTKREAVPQANIDAPRRLLQFAVRDAVESLRPANSPKEPSLKRLRSVVSMSSGVSSLPDHSRRLHSIARVPNPLATAIKAVAEAAEDVVKTKSAGSVFDRIGRGVDVSESPDQHAEFREFVAEDDEYGDLNQTLVENQSMYLQISEHTGQQVRNVAALDSETGLASDFMSDNEGYGDFNVMGHGVVHRNKDQEPPIGAASSSRKVVNISANVNTWKAPHYVEPREVSNLGPQKSIQESETIVGKSSVQQIKENGNSVTVGNVNAKPTGDIQKESHKPLQSAPGSYAASLLTKTQCLIRSAYVEFMRKEAADNALSLDGTSFMSRILKVVKRSSANQEAAPIMSWAQIPRGSSFTAGRFTRSAFARGMSGAFRPWLHVKPGARSLQWKRDAQATPSESGAPVPRNSVSTIIGRGLTYVRTEPKLDGNSGTSTI
ncbi:hypothetical protein SLEP1_g36674 [Rubroshorea leprosula]|uniref:PWI domain-containing protein n=1 Tax=Rubroshorea leprosula TaxID=152421 RepID=A0AAV5KSQ8_9ROSI|nr:hypothetical protein SLEP1_g36674 [Rubroshorea leprosula]